MIYVFSVCLDKYSDKLPSFTKPKKGDQCSAWALCEVIIFDPDSPHEFPHNPHNIPGLVNIEKAMENHHQNNS